MEFCPVCGARILPGMTRCESCGAMVSSSPVPAPAPEASPEQPAQSACSAVPVPQTEPPRPEDHAPGEPTGAPAFGPKYAPSVQEEDGPLSVSACLGTLVLFLIPVVGLVIMLCYSYGKGIPAGRKNLARACLLLTVAFLFLLVLAQLTLLVFSGMVRQAVYSSYFGLY